MERFANRDVCDLTIVDYVTKKPFLYVDFANVTSSELTGESVYAYGGHNHPKRVTFNGERSGTLTLETQIQTFSLYQLITGGTITSAAKFIKREVLTANSGLTLSVAPADGSVNVFAVGDDCGVEIKCTVSDTAVTSDELIDGEKYIAYYLQEMDTVTSISIGANNFPKAVTIYGETFMKTEGEEIIPYKMIAWKAQPQSNASFTFSNTGEPQTLTVTFDLMADTQNGDKILDLIMEDD